VEGGHTLQTLAHPPTSKKEKKIEGGFSAESETRPDPDYPSLEKRGKGRFFAKSPLFSLKL
jgi:hypothetical protein